MRLLLFVFATALSVGACTSGKATEAECNQFREHFIALMTQGVPPAEADKTAELARNMSKELHANCLAEGTSAQIACAAAANDMEEWRRCGDTR
jgi:small lipoprotein (TIGR04454 family)